MSPLLSTAQDVVWRRVVAADAAVLQLARRLERRWMTSLMRTLTGLGETASWLILALVLAASGGRGLEMAQLLLAGALSALLVSQSLKRTFRRARPTAGIADFAALIEDPDAFSFPSGHTAVAFGIAVALAGHGSLGWVLFPLALGIGLSRIYLGAHYPLDVAAGALVGSAAGLVGRSFVDGSLELALEAAFVLAELPPT